MFYYELHMHSLEGSTCGKSNIHEMIRCYAAAGFQGAVITNHFARGSTAIDRSLPWEDFVKGYAQAYWEGLKTAKELDFDLLFGVEEAWGKGKEFLAYGFEPEFLLERPQLYRASLETWSRELRSAGGFLAFAHPFRDRYYITDPQEMPPVELADGVEVYNRGNAQEENWKAEKIFGAKDLICIAGSDAHRNDVTQPWGIALPYRVRTSAQMAQALKNKEFSLHIPGYQAENGCTQTDAGV